MVDPEDEERYRPFLTAKEQYHLFCGTPFDPDQVDPIQNLYNNKPEGGVWVSGCHNTIQELKEYLHLKRHEKNINIKELTTYLEFRDPQMRLPINPHKKPISDEELTTYLQQHPTLCGGTEWLEYIKYESSVRRGSPCYLIKIKDHAHIKELRVQSEIEDFFNHYRITKEEFRAITTRRVKYHKLGIKPEEIEGYVQKYYDYDAPEILNFEQMVRDGLDGVHLTYNGNRETYREEHKAGTSHKTLYGWDAESTILFTSPPKKITDIIDIITTFEPPLKWYERPSSDYPS